MAAQTLRPYQEEGLRRVEQAFAEGARRVLLVLPTGGGKTTMFSTLVARTRDPVLITVHRRELAHQACNRLREFGVQFGLIMAGEEPMPHARVQVASVQTLVKRTAPPAKLVIVDEAHLSTADTWRKTLDHYPHARVLGVTATPWRLSGKPLSGTYDRVVVCSTPEELRQQGFLCDYTGYSYQAPDLSGVGKVGDDYNLGQAGAAMRAPGIVKGIVEQWVKHASDLSTLVFATTVEHSKELTAEFKAAGVRAEHLDGNTPVEQRRAILARVEAGTTRVLCNVGVAVEGLDIPRIKCVVLARPTMSLAKALQMQGRGRRPWNGVRLRIHDHAFVIAMHGLPDQARDYSIHAKREDEALPSIRTCKACLAMYVGGNGCPACEHVNPRETVAGLEHLEIDDVVRFDFDSETPVPTKEKRHVDVRWDTVGREYSGTYRNTGEVQTQWGPRKLYMVETPRFVYALPGTAMLDRLMARVPVGKPIRVSYTGEEIVGNHARKTFRVEIDEPDPVCSECGKEFKLKPRPGPRTVSHRCEACDSKVLFNASRAGASRIEIAQLLGVSKATVTNLLRRAGLGTRKRVSQEVRNSIVALTLEGKTSAEVARRLGVSVSTVEKTLQTRGVSGARKAGRAALRNEVALLRQAGLANEEIAVRTGATYNQVWKIAGKNCNAARDTLIFKFRREGFSLREIAVEVGLTISRVCGILKGAR